MKRYYVQITDGVSGDCALFWRNHAAGYTCDLDDAMIVEEGWRSGRGGDVLREVDATNALAVRHVRRESL